MVNASTPRKMKKRTLVRQMAQGALLAMTLAATRMDGEELTEKKRLFSSDVLDRLRAPLTRYHE